MTVRKNRRKCLLDKIKKKKHRPDEDKFCLFNVIVAKKYCYIDCCE